MAGIPPSLADDPFARRTRWDPLVGGGANFRTRDLVTVNAARVEFPASLGMRLFAGVFLLLAISAGVVGGVSGGWPLVAFGGAFAAVGVGLFYFGTAPVVFDKRHGAFWCGRTAPNEVVNRLALKAYAKLDDIHALQIIRERVRGDDGSYDSFELNLVLTDGRRINVTDHGDYDTLRRNADTLGAFLGRPVWDTVAEEYTGAPGRVS
jgi:hypothetical protein